MRAMADEQKVPLKDIKDRLGSLGISSTTPGLTGEDRYEELQSRLRDALVKIDRQSNGVHGSRPTSSTGEAGDYGQSGDGSLVNLSIGELRYRLSSLGESSSTPGLVADERRAELMKRLVATLCLRDDTDDTEMLLSDSMLQSVAIVDPPRPEYRIEPAPRQTSSPQTSLHIGNNRRPPVSEEPEEELVDNTSALQNEISELKREAKRLANKRSIAIASRLSGPTQDPKLKEEEKTLGKVDAELARLRIQKQSSSSAITASSMLIDSGRMMPIEKLFTKFEAIKNEIKAEIKFHRNKIREEESEHPDYGVQCEEELNNKVKNFSYEKSRTRRKIEEIKTIGTKKKNLLTKLNNKITSSNNTKDEEYDKKFSKLEQKSELNKLEFEDLLADLEMDEKNGLFDKKVSNHQQSVVPGKSVSNGKRPLPPSDPYPDFQKHPINPVVSQPTKSAKEANPAYNGASDDVKGSGDAFFYELMKMEVAGAVKEHKGGLGLGLKEHSEEKNKMDLGTPKSILKKSSDIMQVDASQQKFLFDSEIYDNKEVVGEDDDDYEDDDDDDDDESDNKVEPKKEEETFSAIGGKAAVASVATKATSSAYSDTEDEDEEEEEDVMQSRQSSRRSDHQSSEDEEKEEELKYQVIPPPPLNNPRAAPKIEREDEEEEEEEETTPFPAKDSFATNKFLQKLIEKENLAKESSSSSSSRKGKSGLIRASESGGYREGSSQPVATNLKTPPRSLRPPPPLPLNTVKVDDNTSSKIPGGHLSDDSDYDDLEDDDLDDMDAEEISLQVKTLTRHAAILEKSGDIASAETLYERALELDPVHVEVLYKFARLLHNRRGNIQRAESLYARAVQMSIPQLHIEIMSPSRARALTISPQSQRPSSSISPTADEKKLAAIGKRGTKLRVLVGMLLSYAGFAKRAKADINVAHILYKKALELAPESAKVLGDVAYFLSEEGFEIPLAIELFAKCVKASPNNVLNTMRYAKLLKKMGKYNESELLYKASVLKSLDDKKMEPTAYCNYATFLCKVRKNMNLSYENFKLGLEKYPNHKGLLKNFDIFLRSNPDFVYDNMAMKQLPPKRQNQLSEKVKMRIVTEIRSFNESQAASSPKTLSLG